VAMSVVLLHASYRHQEIAIQRAFAYFSAANGDER